MVLASVLMAAALVCDGGFENGGTGWRLGKEVNRIEVGAGRNGSKGLVWENDDENVYRFAKCDMTLEPGVSYRFSGWVKSYKIENRLSSKNRAYLSIEWRDSDGRWMSIVSADPVVDNQEQKDGWVRYEGMTPIMPANLGRTDIVCSVFKGSVGKVAFDDIEVEPVASKPVPTILSSAYRDMAATGKVEFAATYMINTVKDPIDTVSASFVFICSNGEKRISPSVFTNGVAKASIAVEALAIGENPVRFEMVRKDGSLIGAREMACTRVKTLPDRKVYIDSHGRTIVDGKPFFPLGLYSSSRQAGSIDIYREGPFNCILPYGITVKRETLDLYHSRGLKVIVGVTSLSGIRGSDLKGIADERAYTSRYLEAFTDHPALLAWYIADEPKVFKVDNLKMRNMQIRAYDPHHPTFVVSDSMTGVGDFVECFDVVAMDPYPIGNSSGARRAGIACASQYAQAAMRAMHGYRGLWQVPQTFDWTWYRPWAAKEGAHMPTREELKNMNWQAVAAGANGLVGWWFAGMIRELLDKGKEAEFRRVWEDVKVAYEDVAARIPLLLSVEPAPKVVKVPEDVVARTWTKDGETWLLVVNRNAKPTAGKVVLAGGKIVPFDLKALESAFVKID